MKPSKIFSCAAVTMVLFAAQTNVTTAAETLRLGGVHSPTSFETQSLEHFAQLVEEKTNGELTIQVFPASQLGDAVSMIENVKIGAQDMFANVSNWNSHIVSDYGILGMPFAFSDITHLKRFQKSDVFLDMKARMISEQGLRVLADNYYRLPRVLVTKQPVSELADIQGLLMRMANISVFLETWEALGAKPTVIPWAESYLALRTGVVDGLDSPLSSIYSQQFYLAVQYVTMTNHSVAPFNILISEISFSKLSATNQSMLIEAAEESGDFYTQMIEDNFAPQRTEMLESGVTFSEIDTIEFVASASEVAARLESEGKWATGLFALIQGL
ncbi:hypothetical protein A9Q96_16960 [Rhodobacterales bacterium 52_120_T64]|mgnify:CR=1 FL=1|nr:hypothetical protein A9Q96_16960 [Rhodobacterales bacterium 52_120_T64]